MWYLTEEELRDEVAPESTTRDEEVDDIVTQALLESLGLE